MLISTPHLEKYECQRDFTFDSAPCLWRRLRALPREIMKPLCWKYKLWFRRMLASNQLIVIVWWFQRLTNKQTWTKADDWVKQSTPVWQRSSWRDAAGAASLPAGRRHKTFLIAALSRTVYVTCISRHYKGKNQTNGFSCSYYASSHNAKKMSKTKYRPVDP